jgi:3-hydroxyisobutyrate dehydrogenase
MGRMGTPICANLVEAGHRVAAYDIRPEREAAASDCGAAWCGSGREAAAGADVLVLDQPEFNPPMD